MSYPLGTQEQEQIVQASTGNQLDVKKILYKIIGILPWVILGLIIATITANLYLRYTPSEYKVAAYMLVKKEDEASAEYRVFKELGVFQSMNDVLNQIDILKSYTIAERVVDSLRLNIHVREEGRVTKSQVYGDDMPFTFKVIQANEHSWPRSFQLSVSRDGYQIKGPNINQAYKWGDTLEVEYGKLILERNVLVKKTSGTYLLDFTTKHQEAANLKGALKIELTNDKGGGIVEISMEDQIPERAIAIINTLITVFNDADLADKNIITNRTVKFLGDRVDSVSKELTKLEAITQEYKKNHRITDIAMQGGIFQNQAMNIDGQRVKEYTQYKILDALENYMSNFKGTTEIIPSTMGIGEQALQTLIIQHNSYVVEKQELEKRSASSDPHLLDKAKQILDLRENILHNIKLLKKAFAQTVADLESSFNSLENRIGSLPEEERVLQGLKRLATVKEELYVYLLKKKEEAQLLLASNINNTRVIDYATDLGPIKPNKSQIKLLAWIIGIIIPVGIMILKDFFNNKVTEKKEIEAATNVPIVGELSYLKKKRPQLIDIKSKSPIAEQFRLLRTNLYFASPSKQVKTIMVSSFMSGEGKSFVSLNLANALSVTGAKTIILEFDLRNPSLGKILNLSNETGLSTYFSTDISFDEVIQPIAEMNNTSIITSGPIPPNPAELLLSYKTTALFDFLKNNFDYIIIDTAPVGLVTDALLLEKYADLTLFIIRHRFTLKAILPYIEKLNQEKKFRHMGIVVNGIKKDGSYGFSFGFGYSYSKYISEKRKSLFTKLTSLFKG